MHNGKALKKADPSTIQDKLLVGYQGWFTCAGDGEPVGRGHHGWLHWFNYPVPDGGRPNTDIWPDVSEYDPSELYEAPGLRTQSGEKCYLFSSRNQKTVDRHFNWMAQHGVDGAFLQRFAGQCDGRGENNGIRRIRDEIGERVREAAEKNGRVFAIMYDVSGVPPGKIEEIIKYDWKYIVFNKRVFDSPSYLREKGKPVVALWGFGFEDSRHTPGLVRSIASYINSSHPGGVYLMAGVPAHWRTSTGDADRNPDFVDVWLNSFDAISPWTIGRYGNIVDADKFAEEKIAEDMKFVSERNKTARLERRLDYIPVVFPGGSGYNLSEGKWGFNDIPREGGKFLWRQVYNARRHGVRTIYGAMWDEYDEGTALMPLVTNKNQLPLPVRDQYRFLAPDADTHDLPSDWYMRICGMAGEILRGDRRLLETFPHKELQDYWGTRPRYEDGTRGGYVPANSTPGASGSGPAHTLAIEENPDEPPPPPYTLEADDGPAESTPPTQGGSSTAPATPDDRKYNVPDLVNDLGRHTLGGPSSHSPSHLNVPGGLDPQPTSSLHANVSSTKGSPSLAFNKPTSPPESTTPLSSSYFSPPPGPPPGMPSIPFPQVTHGLTPNHSVNLNTPFHWNDDYPKPQLPSPGGFDVGNPTSPWDPPASTKPHDASFNKLGKSSQSGYDPSYPSSQSTYPGQGPPPTHSPYPGPGHSQQSSYPGQTHSGPSLSSNSPPLSQGPGGYGQHQSSYPGVTNSLAPVPPDRPPTHPPTSNSPPLPQGYGQHQSPYPGMANSPAPGPDRPPMSQPSRPTTPYHQATVPPQAQPPPLPGGYNYPGPTQSTYGGMNPSASPLPTLPHQQTGPGPHGYQQPTQPQYPGYNPPPPSTSPYPGYSGYHPTPPLPPHRQDWPPYRPTSSGGPSGPGFNQIPHQAPYSPQQPLPPQSYGGHTTGLTYSASTSSPYQNATPWKKQQTGVVGLAKDTVDMLTGKEARKDMQASIQSVLKPFMK